MREPRWVSRHALDLMHAALIQRYGGAEGVRAGGDELIDSALARPRNRFAYEPESSLADLAAAYLYGLAKNHGYLDGNKRIGFAAAVAFLRANGIRLTADEDEAYTYVIGLVEDRHTEQDVAAWIASRSAPGTQAV
jgi:death-on-curing protein